VRLVDAVILRQEFDELKNAPELFLEDNFQARKEALDFVRFICEFWSAKNVADNAFINDVKAFGEDLRSYSEKRFSAFRQRLIAEKPSPNEFRKWILPYTNYRSGDWGKPHYGYESLDFLLDGVFFSAPKPEPDRRPEYGMVRYEPTPASVILELTERIEFTTNDVFYDLGSGLGKVAMLVALLTGVDVCGVEYQTSFCAYAEEQSTGLGLERTRYLNADARDVAYVDGTVFFLFNPFGGLIFDAVLDKLHGEAQKREIQFFSYGSSSQPLSELAWLKPIKPVGTDEMALALFRSECP
jgi:hypothetical protein